MKPGYVKTMLTLAAVLGLTAACDLFTDRQDEVGEVELKAVQKWFRSELDESFTLQQLRDLKSIRYPGSTISRSRKITDEGLGHVGTSRTSCTSSGPMGEATASAS